MHGRHRLVLLLVIALFVACGAPASTEPQQVPEEEQQQDFWDLMNEHSIDYDYHPTLRSLWEASDAAIIGQILEAREGRGFGGRKGGPRTVESVLLRVRVDELVRGELDRQSTRFLQLELLRPPLVSVRDLNATLPADRMVLLVHDAASVLPDNVEIDETGAEREGGTIYTVPSLKAIFIERDAELATPLDETPGEFERSYSATTLEELAEEIRQL